MSNIALQSTAYDKKNPFPARLIEKRKLTAPGSGKETYHFVVDIAGSGMQYQSGDSLALLCPNNPQEIQDLLGAAKLSGRESVTLPKSESTVTLLEALTHNCSLTGPTPSFLRFLQNNVSDETEAQAIAEWLKPESAEKLTTYLQYRHFVDVLEDFPSANLDADTLVAVLKRQLPRLYSIASSPTSYPNEVHLTVAIIRYEFNGRKRGGVASTFLADRAEVGAFQATPEFHVYVNPSHFHLPEDLSKDIIMVGPGTGVAPYRGFMQERIDRAASGRSWLFFGEQHRATDYLYQEDWEAWKQSGALDRLDLAFSRDQTEKVYVQNRMLENAAELWQWIENGAYFYLCGDAHRMAKDVEATLLKIIEEQSKMSPAETLEYFKRMKKDKRYQKDVY